MSNKNTAKIAVYALLVVGFSVGALRAWHELKAKDMDAQVGVQDCRVSLVSTRTKAGWIMIQSIRFASEHPGEIVSADWMESRESMEKILDGTLKPDLWSPESPIWIARLNDVWKAKHGTDLVSMDDPSSLTVLLNSPIVFLTTKEKASYLRPILAGSRPWSSIRDLALGKLSAPWGRVHFSHADPLNSYSGTLTLALILNEYIQEHGANRTPEQTVSSPGFAAYLTEIESIMLYDKPARDGTYALSSDYAQHPEKRDFIVTHESAALSAAERNPDLEVIYPNPTADSQETIGVLNAPWVTEQQRAIGQQYIASLLSARAMRSATQSNMRSASPAGADSLNPTLDKMSKQGFQETYSSIRLPSYDVLNTLAYLRASKSSNGANPTLR